MNKWTPGLLIFGFWILLLSSGIFVVLSTLAMDAPGPNYLARKVRHLFLSSELAQLTWPALFGVICSMLLIVRGFWLLRKRRNINQPNC